LNDKPNCQVSRILMNPRPILSDSSENHPIIQFLKIMPNSIFHTIFFLQSLLVDYLKTMNMDLIPFVTTVVKKSTLF
jgi:hypothetical protein